MLHFRWQFSCLSNVAGKLIESKASTHSRRLWKPFKIGIRKLAVCENCFVLFVKFHFNRSECKENRWMSIPNSVRNRNVVATAEYTSPATPGTESVCPPANSACQTWCSCTHFSVVVIIESQPYWGTQCIHRTVTDVQITNLTRFPGIIASANVITDAMGQQMVNVGGTLYPLLYDLTTAQCITRPPNNVCPCCWRWGHGPQQESEEKKQLTSINRFD